MKLIGFVGVRRSGKDTAAAALVQDGYQLLRFAGPLKAMLTTYLVLRGADAELIERLLEGDLKEKPCHYFEGRSPRFAMQTLGSEWGRDLIHSNIWVNTAIDRAQQVEKAVIADVRFPNEADAIRRAGGTLVKILRPGTDVDSHPSESLIESISVHWHLCNDSSVETLQRATRKIAERIYGKS